MSVCVSNADKVMLVKSLADRLSDPKNMLRKLSEASTGLEPHMSIPWKPLSLAHGYPGLLLLFATLDKIYPTESWDCITHLYVLKVKETIEENGIKDLSLFTGLAGACFALQKASKEGTRYQKMLEKLCSSLFSRARSQYVDPLSSCIKTHHAAPPDLYDLISGISGIGAFAIHYASKEALEFSKETLNLCVYFGDKMQVGEEKLPGWFVPCKHLNPVEQRFYPEGNFNLGIAHGVTGILAFLSAAALRGIVVEGQMEVINKLANWVYSRRKEKDNTTFWCTRASLEETGPRDESGYREVPREGWCDGSAGISRILFLAGKALRNRELQDLATKAFISIFQRIKLETAFESPTLCHGLSGFLLITSLMIRDTQNKELKDWPSLIENRLLTFYQTAFPFGFKDREYSAKDPFEGKKIDPSLSLNQELAKISIDEVDNVGLLGGVAGILLSLLHDEEECPSWCTPLLI